MGNLFLCAANPSGDYANDDYGAKSKKYTHGIYNNLLKFKFLFSRYLMGALWGYGVLPKPESSEEFSHVC